MKPTRLAQALLGGALANAKPANRDEAREQAKRDWNDARSMFDEDGDNRLSFDELLKFFARSSGIQVDQIPDEAKAALRANFD